MKVQLIAAFVIVAGLVVGCTAPAEPTASADAPKPVANSTSTASGTPVSTTKSYALIHFATWCGKCKELDPKVKKVMAEAEAAGVKFVMLDFSDKAKSADQQKIADEAGLGQFAQIGSTGFINVISGDKSKKITTITSSMSEEEIKKALLDSTKA